MQSLIRFRQILHDRQFRTIARNEDATGESRVDIAEEQEPTTEQ